MPRSCVICDCSYNLTKQLVKLNKLIWNIDDYISQARRAKHVDCAKALTDLKTDLVKHAVKLKKIIVKKAVEGKF